MAHRHQALLNEPCEACQAEPLVQWPDGSYYEARGHWSSALMLLVEGVALAIVAWIVLVALLGAQ